VAEKAYAARVKQIENTKTGADAEKALADLRAEEIARLEKAYLNGKLPKDYLDERRFNVSQGAHEKRVPFGASERPSFNTFKKGYEEELLGGDLNEEEVRMFYDRMMENARISEKQFILTAAGKMPRPTLESPEPQKVEAVEPIKESIDVLNDIKDTVTETSKPIIVQSPQSVKEKGL
jgi:hypothetical protein